MDIRVPEGPHTVVDGLGKIMENAVPVDRIMRQHVFSRYENGKETDNKEKTYRDDPECLGTKDNRPFIFPRRG